MEKELDMNTQKALESLRRRKPNATISIAADLANDDINSICRIALAWIADGNVHGISYLVKPPSAEFTSRVVTAGMVADSPSFQTVWDSEIKALLKNEILSAYRSEKLFLAIKSSYEASGEPFQMSDVYVRDLKFLAGTYIPDLGNDSFITIMHFMKIPVDLDNALSRAMGCICGLAWLERLYPVTNYGIPLSAIMAGALCPQTPPLDPEAAAAAAEAARKKYARLNYYSKILFIPFLILCVFLTLYYVHRYTESHKHDVDFAAYKTSSASIAKDAASTQPGTKEYSMQQGTYVVIDASILPDFIQAMESNDTAQLQELLKTDMLIALPEPAKIEVLGLDRQGFMAVKILDGIHKGKTGIAPIVMIHE